MRTKLIAFVMALLPIMGLAQGPAGADLSAEARDSKSIAQTSLATLVELASKDGAALGFASPGDAKRAELSLPLSDFIIGLDSLRSWQANMNPLGLLRPTGLVINPVHVAGSVQPSITVKKQNGQWQAVSFGAPKLAASVAGNRERVVTRSNVQLENIFQVRIPAFNISFVAHIENGMLLLSPVSDYPQYGYLAGVPIAADQVLSRLQPDAERDQGLPR
jgi:hypothetical protein